MWSECTSLPTGNPGKLYEIEEDPDVSASIPVYFTCPISSYPLLLVGSL
jgi:hypothetical protein